MNPQMRSCWSASGRRLRPSHREAERHAALRLQHHEEALHVAQPLSLVFFDPWPISEKDVALFDDLFVRARTLAARGFPSHGRHRRPPMSILG